MGLQLSWKYILNWNRCENSFCLSPHLFPLITTLPCEMTSKSQGLCHSNRHQHWTITCPLVQIATDNRQLSWVLSWPWCPKTPIHLSIDLLPSTTQRCPSSVVKERITYAFLVKLYIHFDNELVPLSFPFGDLFFLFLFLKGPVSLSKRVFCDCIVSFACINIECVCNQGCVWQTDSVLGLPWLLQAPHVNSDCMVLCSTPNCATYMLCIEKRGSEKQRTEGWVVKWKRGLDKNEPCDRNRRRIGKGHWLDKYTTQQCHLADACIHFFFQTHEAVRIYRVDAPVT